MGAGCTPARPSAPSAHLPARRVCANHSASGGDSTQGAGSLVSVLELIGRPPWTDRTESMTPQALLARASSITLQPWTFSHNAYISVASPPTSFLLKSLLIASPQILGAQCLWNLGSDQAKRRISFLHPPTPNPNQNLCTASQINLRPPQTRTFGPPHPYSSILLLGEPGLE